MPGTGQESIFETQERSRSKEIRLLTPLLYNKRYFISCWWNYFYSVSICTWMECKTGRL